MLRDPLHASRRGCRARVGRWPEVAVAGSVLLLVLGCATDRDSDGVVERSELPANLASLLPAKVADTFVTTGFVVDTDLTERSVLTLDDRGAGSEDLVVHSWVLTHPGTLEQALADLGVPDGAEVRLPTEGSLGASLAREVDFLEPRVESTWGTSWVVEARERAEAWSETAQRTASISFVEAEPDAEVAAAALDAGQDVPELDIRAWLLVFADPVVALEDLDLHEGTHLVVRLTHLRE